MNNQDISFVLTKINEKRLWRRVSSSSLHSR